MNLIHLSTLDLSLTAILILLLAGLSWLLRLGIGKDTLIAAVRTTVQLLLVGFVLKIVFAHAAIGWVGLMAIVMLLAAGREVMVRQKRRLSGAWGFAVGTGSMFVSTFAITIVVLIAVIGIKPWYEPQYSIPLLGMMLGNTMTGIALGMDYLSNSAWQHKSIIEGRLALGQDWQQAIADIRRDSMRIGMMPMINAMAAAGLVSLPGMMTGQILSGSPPMEAVKYQILIMFMISAGTGFGTMAAVWMTARRLFDERERLRLDRLTKPRR
ncbi:MAG TPA: iron export ABC transporter permease subunit FetB [Acidiferrobacteraceae bacterium]|nr:iron export ABC transporter permease subunit FetB [Acidiferrobacteraceae bacterium]HEX19841.1 iron export ABC transporter permease subunit FetB [Acidiferrobacteraceae bacterium]